MSWKWSMKKQSRHEDRINRVSSNAYFCSPMDGEVLAHDAVGLNIMKAKRLLEAFVTPAFLYGWSTIVYHKVNDNKLRAVVDTAWRMMLGL
ncbi:hypothetical protein ACTXT7_017039 [Hymenolepis weldensis]